MDAGDWLDGTSGVTVKLIDPDDSTLGFVLNSWLKSYEPRGRHVHGLDRRDYFRTHHPEVTRLLRASRVALATLDDDDNAYLGWACGAPGVIHFVYVKDAFREQGIARRLVAEVAGDPRVYTFEPSTRFGGDNHKRGYLRTGLVQAAERKGLKFHAHPIPGVLVRQQLQERSR